MDTANIFENVFTLSNLCLQTGVDLQFEASLKQI